MKRLILIVLLCSTACASQAKLHPNISPVGQVVANVNTIDDAVILLQRKVIAFVDAYCGPNQTPTCQGAQIAAPVMRVSKVIGDTSKAIGDAFAVYLAAKDATAKAAAKATLFEKITALQMSSAELTVLAFTAIKPDAEAIVRDVAALNSSAKGL